MKAVGILVTAEARRHWARVLLTSLATAASACLVIWVIGGYDALVGRSGTLATQLLGPYDLILQTRRAAREYPSDAVLAEAINPRLLKRLQSDPDVAGVEPVMVVRTRMLYPVRPRGRDFGGERKPKRPNARGGSSGARTKQGSRTPSGEFRTRGPGGTILTGTHALQSPYAMAEGHWFDTEHPQRMEAVISSSLARGRMPGAGGLNLRDVFLAHGLGGEFRLALVGTVDQPRTVRSFGGIYTSMAVAEKISGRPARINRVHIDLKDGVAAADFEGRWKQRLDGSNPPLALTKVDDLKAEIDEGRQMAILEQQRFYASGVSILAATFIIFTTLSMGVSERIRQFAVLRAVGMTRAQVARVVFGESGLIAAAGWVIGVGAGWALLQLNPDVEAGLLAGTVPLSFRCILISTLCVVLGATAAALLPAWSATRLLPLDVMSSTIKPRRVVLPVAGVIAGLLLICVNPLLVYGVSVSSHFRYASYMLVGCTSMALGFVLVAPLAVVLVERILGPLLAAVLWLSRHLVSQQLSTNLWPSVGTVSCLTVGLGLFVSIQVWGHSMAVPFLPGDNLPDVVISFLPAGLPESEIDAVKQTDGIVADQCVPVAVEQAKVTQELLQSEGLTRPRQKAVYLFMAEQDNVLFLGMDPQQAIGGENPIVEMTFVEGDRQTAIEKLSHGRCCLVPDHFHVETGLGVGDRLTVIPPGAPDARLTWEIAGVVSVAGWQWVTKMSGMRRNAPKTLAAVFISYDSARRDFGLKRVHYFWANTQKDVDGQRLREAVQAIADRNANVRFQLPEVGEVTTSKPFVSVTGVQQVGSATRDRVAEGQPTQGVERPGAPEAQALGTVDGRWLDHRREQFLDRAARLARPLRIVFDEQEDLGRGRRHVKQ